MKEFRVIVKVQAANCREAVELAAQRLNEGGEPDAVLTCELSFPDPEVEGAQVKI